MKPNEVVSRDPKVMGALVFTGTRVLLDKNMPRTLTHLLGDEDIQAQTACKS